MFGLPAQTRVFLACDPTDMRKSFRGLLILTEAVLQQAPISGHLFVFLNRRRELMKVLYWETSGYAIWYKRLEVGRFQMPVIPEHSQAGIELTGAQLSLILQGIDLRSVKQRIRYSPALSRQNSPAGNHRSSS